MYDLLGSKVKIRYTGTLDDGTVFDSSKQQCDCDALEYVVGSSTKLPAFNKALSEMQKVGDTVTIRIPAAEAYGTYKKDFIEAVPVDALPDVRQLPVGERVRIQTQVGVIQAKVLEIKGEFVYLDYNHELVDQDLNYTIELVGFQSALEREYDPARCACGCDKMKKTLEA